MASITKYKKKDGTYYEAVLSLSGHGPDRVRIKKKGFKTKKEAQDWAALEQVKYNLRGKTSAKTSAKARRADALSFRDVSLEWLTRYEATVKPSTYRKTEGLFTNHIWPAFENKTLSKITTPELQGFVTNMRDKLVNYGQIYDYTRNIFNYASEVGYIAVNPFNAVKKPRKQDKHESTKPTKQLNKQELSAFLSAAKEYEVPAAYPYFRLLAYTGLRRGEIAALEWSDIDFQEGTLSVNKAVTVDIVGAPIIGSPKNKTSIRTIAIDQETLQTMREWSDFIRPVMDGLGHTTDLVFPNQYGKLTNFSRPQKWLKKIAERADVPSISLHGLRHTHCTLLIEAGANIKAVQERLGHSDIETTLSIYSHVNKGIERQAVNSLLDYLG